VPDGIDVSFLKKFRKLLLGELKKGRKFILVAGGGKTARMYQQTASQIVRLTGDDLDWIGIHSIKLNAHLLRIIFQKKAYPTVIDEEPSLSELRKMQRPRNRLLIASGWKPGWSTDYVTVKLAQRFAAKEVIIAGNTPFVYEKDPKRFRNAKALKELTWSEYQELIPKKWSPGLSTPVDPVAAKLARKIGLTAKIIQGTNLSNFKKAIEGKSFRGTLIV